MMTFYSFPIFWLSVQFQIKFFSSLMNLFLPHLNPYSCFLNLFFIHFAWKLCSCTPVKVTSSNDSLAQNCQWFCFVYNRFHLLNTWLAFLCFPSIILFYIWLFMFQLNHVCLFFGQLLSYLPNLYLSNIWHFYPSFKFQLDQVCFVHSFKNIT